MSFDSESEYFTPLGPVRPQIEDPETNAVDEDSEIGSPRQGVKRNLFADEDSQQLEVLKDEYKISDEEAERRWRKNQHDAKKYYEEIRDEFLGLEEKMEEYETR